MVKEDIRMAAFLKESSRKVSPVFVAHVLGVAAVAAVTGYWVKRLDPPAAPTPVSATAAPAALPTDPAAGIVAGWLGPGALRIDIAVLGLAVRDGRAVALLRVNDTPPRAYVVGETLTRGTTLAAIEPAGITIARDGERRQIPAPAVPAALRDTSGLVRVR
jgi:general secretion pathway protein C